MILLVASGLAAGSVWPLSAQTPPEMKRIPFQIATGPVSGSYLPLGEALAMIISHPPGLGRCDIANACGPEGLIATTRSSSGSVSNALAVERGSVQSALVQGDVAAAAISGQGPFEESGPLKNVRVIARLHDETLQIVAASRSGIRHLKDLAGRRVAIDTENSATEYTVRSLLGVAGVKFSSLKIKRVSAERAADDLRDGKIDALFVTGVSPIQVVDQLTRQGYVRLVPVESRTLQKLARKSPMYSKVQLPAGTYRSSKSVSALGVTSLWIVNSSQPSNTVIEILRAFWNPVNQTELRKRGEFAKMISLRKSLQKFPVPLHDGAKRFYAASSR